MKERRDRIRARLADVGADALLVTKPVNVRYLSGYSGSNGQLIVGSEDVFMTDGRYEEQSRHEVPDIRRDIYGVSSATIGEAAGMYGTVESIVSDLNITRLGVEAGHMTLETARAIRETIPSIELIETTEEVETLRAVKDGREIAALQRAFGIADDALAALMNQLKEGMTEIELAAILEYEMREGGSDGVSFDTIAGFGENAAEPHHHPTTRSLKRGDMIKVDFGAMADGYHSDMTRVVAFGEPSAEMVEIYKIVRAANQAGLDSVRAGVTSGAIDDAARSIVRERGYDYGHGTGHGVGLEIHESPPVRHGADLVLQEGMALTVEPGIYIPGTGGVRIEDTVIVRPDGCDILTGSTKELVII